MSTLAASTDTGLVRAVGRWSLVALVLNSVIGAGVFGVPSLAVRTLGATRPLTYLLAVVIAALGIAAIMACFAEVASRFTAAGGPYLYARTAFGRFIGIEMGWLAWLVRLTSAAAVTNLFIIYMAEFWPAVHSGPARAAVLTLLIGFLAIVNYRGVRAGAAVSNIFIVAKLVPLTVFVLGGAVYVLMRGTASAPAAATAASGDWFETLLILTFLFGGFEAALIGLGEARNPRRDAPFALFTALLVCTIFFSAIQVLVVALLPAPAQTDRPLALAARIFLGPAGGILMAVGALLSVYGYLSSMSLNVPRLTFALAEQGDFPQFFARVHPRYRTPYVSILVFAFLTWVLAVWGTFTWNVVLSSIARLMTYGLVCAALPVLRWRRAAEAQFHLPAGPLFAAVGLVFAGVLVARMGRREIYALAVTMGFAFVNWLLARSRRHAQS